MICQEHESQIDAPTHPPKKKLVEVQKMFETTSFSSFIHLRNFTKPWAPSQYPKKWLFFAAYQELRLGSAQAARERTGSPGKISFEEKLRERFRYVGLEVSRNGELDHTPN